MYHQTGKLNHIPHVYFEYLLFWLKYWIWRKWTIFSCSAILDFKDTVYVPALLCNATYNAQVYKLRALMTLLALYTNRAQWTDKSYKMSYRKLDFEGLLKIIHRHL